MCTRWLCETSCCSFSVWSLWSEDTDVCGTGCEPSIISLEHLLKCDFILFTNPCILDRISCTRLSWTFRLIFHRRSTKEHLFSFIHLANSKFSKYKYWQIQLVMNTYNHLTIHLPLIEFLTSSIILSDPRDPFSKEIDPSPRFLKVTLVVIEWFPQIKRFNLLLFLEIFEIRHHSFKF